MKRNAVEGKSSSRRRRRRGKRKGDHNGIAEDENKWTEDGEKKKNRTAGSKYKMMNHKL